LTEPAKAAVVVLWGAAVPGATVGGFEGGGGAPGDVGANRYVNWSSDEVALVPLGVFTVMSTAPLPAGEVAVIWVGLSTVNEVAGLPPKFTAEAPVKLLPPIVTLVPPAAGPELGLTLVTAGAGGAPPIEYCPDVTAGRSDVVEAEAVYEPAVLGLPSPFRATFTLSPAGIVWLPDIKQVATWVVLLTLQNPIELVVETVVSYTCPFWKVDRSVVDGNEIVTLSPFRTPLVAVNATE
jgi:hypothetical protein